MLEGLPGEQLADGTHRAQKTPASSESRVPRPQKGADWSGWISGNWAVSRCRARAPRNSPGAITPPCQTPAAEIRSMVIAVPHETTSPGWPWGMCSRAARTASARSAPPVSAPSTSILIGTSAAVWYHVDLVDPAAREEGGQPLGDRWIDRCDRPARRLILNLMPVVPERLPGQRVVRRQGARGGELARLIEPGPLEPGISQVGHDAEHG